MIDKNMERLTTYPMKSFSERMKKQYLTSLIISLFIISCTSQELTCSEFRIGKFHIPTTEELKEMTVVTNDSIRKFEIELDSTVNKTVIVRKEHAQIEWTNGIGSGSPKYEVIEWIDDCTYRLTYDSSISELDEDEKWINENNGIVVSSRKIEGKCMFYNATMTTNNGQEISQEGTICKE